MIADKGDAPLFPIAIVNLSSLGYDDRLPWVLQVRPDPASPAMGALHLLVNEHAVDVVDALAHAAAPEPAHTAVLSALHYDVGRTLIEYALTADGFNPEAPQDEESLGDVLQGLLTQTLGTRSPATLRRIRDEDPAIWASELAAGLGLFPARAT